MTVSKAEELIWYPGIYEGRTTPEYTQMVEKVPFDTLVTLVKTRAEEDGEWAIANNLVGDNEDKMRRMMEFVSDTKHIEQCHQHILDNETASTLTVDWVCRDLANASKWAASM